MPGFYLFKSNRTESLAEILSDRLRHSEDPMNQETIVVQSRGMQRWLSLQIAEKNGICANIDFPFPKHFAQKLFREIIGLPEKYPFSRQIMTWDIMSLLPGFSGHPAFECVDNYISGEETEMKLFQLSGKIADIFDQYLIFRPELIMDWDAARNPMARLPHSEWQSELWRKLSLEIGKGSQHLASMKYSFLEKIKTENLKNKLPQRISVFGISSLPAFYMDIFKALSEKIDIDFYYLNPCREFWECALSEKEMARLANADDAEDAMHFDAGNSLLASAGKTGREFFSLIMNLEGREFESFEEPGEATALKCIQSDILKLQNRGKDIPRKILPFSDKSVQLHSCHSESREIEVLFDALLNLFKTNKNLRPRDIVVMAPDISIYAPFIDAVFGCPEKENMKMPYSIADRRVSEVNSVAETFLDILSLHQKRTTSLEVMKILESPSVQSRFGILETDMPAIKGWLRDSGIRWGINAESRKKLGLPEYHENSWKFGMDRLLLGYAMPSDKDKGLFSGIFPFETGEAESKTLGAFATFTNALFTKTENLANKMTLREWSETLNDILETFFASEKTTEKEIQELRNIINEGGISKASGVSSFREKISCGVILSFLKQSLGNEPSQAGFFNGGITFCSLLPMRSIPFKTICLLGMNDGKFPRNPLRAGFNLMEKSKRLCDPDKRAEDRYLFLETLLSARDNAIISYVGQSLKDNSKIPPSPLLSELCDYIDDAFKMEDGQKATEHIITEHPLHPFSPQYFNGNKKLFSFSEENCSAAGASCSRRTERKNIIPPLPPPTDIARSISLNELINFFMNPSKFLLTKRLNIYAETNDAEELEEREIFKLDKLQEYLIKQELLEASLAGKNPGALFETIKASGKLPLGCAGQTAFEKLESQAKLLAETVRPECSDKKPETTLFEIELDKFSIQATLKELCSKGQIIYRCANINPKDRLRAWLKHLSLNCAEKVEAPKRTVLIGQDKKIIFQELQAEEARDILNMLLAYYETGFERALKFFPKSSLTFAEKILGGKNETQALSEAAKAWLPGYMQKWQSESEDFFIKTCFPEFPADKKFGETALDIFGPILNCEYGGEQ
jgi:exodeoxyribonuclease V gamma subunit